MAINPPFTENGRTIFNLRYPRKGEDGQPVETPEGVIRRVAQNVAIVSVLYSNKPVSNQAAVSISDFPYRTAQRQRDWLVGRGGRFAGLDLGVAIAANVDLFADTAERYEALLGSLAFLPNSPTWTGAGTPLGQLAACFVLPIDDDLGRTPTSIYGTLRNAALIQQTGGGNGFSFSGLRPSGETIKTSMGKASGPMGFLRVYDSAFRELAQGGSRRGANMAVMRIDHPDVLDFIRAKTVEGEFDQFNFSVAVTDEFMDAVDKDEDFDLRWDGRVHTTVSAKDLYDEIIDNAWVMGDPGNLFIDRANRDNPCPTRYVMVSTNPCVTGDTWVMTSTGPRCIQDIVTDFEDGDEDALWGEKVFVNGELHRASDYTMTGVKPVFVLSTNEGYELRLTADHRVMTLRGWVEAGSLCPGDEVVLHDHGDDIAWECPGIDDWTAGHGEDEGYVLGVFAGDGTFGGKDHEDAILSVWETDPGFEGVRDAVEAAVRSHMTRSQVPVRSDWTGWTGPYGNGWYRLCNRAVSHLVEQYYSEPMGGHKMAPTWMIEQGSSTFYEGFLRGLFDADGHVEGGNGSPNVRLSNSDLDLIQAVQRMLLRLGMFSRIYRMKAAGSKFMPDGKGGEAEYEVRESWRLVIAGKSLRRFARRIGFANSAKRERLDGLIRSMSRGPYNNPFRATVAALVPDGEEKVYDVSVEGVHAFDANGLYVHNCGEQWLGPHENCCLGSIALQRFVTTPFWVDSIDKRLNRIDERFDWEGFRQAVVTATEFLDDVVDANQYVPDVPALEAAAMGGRRIGLGLMGMADALAMMGLRYGSEEALDFVSQVTEFARWHSMLTSIRRARDRGPFEWINGSIYDPILLAREGEGAEVTLGLHESHQDYDPDTAVAFRLWARPEPLVEHRENFGRPEVDWGYVLQHLCEYGIRNSAQFTFAPTGTISNVAGCEGSGCEPFFALAYTRTVMQEGENVSLAYGSPLFEQALRSEVTSEAEVQRILRAVADNGGSCQGVEGIPVGIEAVFVTAADVSPAEHVWTQAALQAWVDNSISKTINLPNSATREDVADAYRLAYDLGCKGITIYRQGSRQLEVLSTARAEEAAEEAIEHVHELGGWPEVEPLPIPASAKTEGLAARVFPVETFYGKVQVTITEHPDHPGRPFDIRLQIGKAGNDTNAHVEALGRMISLGLRAGLKVADIVSQLEGIGGATVHGFGPNRVRSVADGIAGLLRRTYMAVEDFDGPTVWEEVRVTTIAPDGVEELAGGRGLCPDCGNATMVPQQGCWTCDPRIGGCGYSKCD
jgi:ribonucleoside-diphosphate reductase alpha chain